MNGEARKVPAGSSVASLLQALGVAREHVAVELNGELLGGRSAPCWERIPLLEGAEVEIVRFVGGG